MEEALLACGRLITIGVYYNDIWSYNLDCKKWGDTSCVDEGWTIEFKGARLGGW